MGSQFLCFFLWILRLIGENPLVKDQILLLNQLSTLLDP
ncbi:hypothetical protein SLEP1_g43065 [Rubroshorea leprosula]|uniref:Uncharacterized protein n=1 Tax=Rubroshorea leprosula TaxID=152421 RepID=A0AAV5LBT8_9ROSI|nr:hypothetical protein SLEP1_g43065 [Rubroshorea leprosula]